MVTSMGWESAARGHADMPRAVDPDFWRDTLTREPQIMHRLLGDMWAAVEANRGAPGRASLPTVEEVFRLVIPDYSSDPFPAAVRGLLGDRSIRWLAGRVHLHHSHVHRWLTGQREVVNLHDPVGSMAQIDAIAKALNVHPAYFAEWRRLWVLVLIDDALANHPNLSIGVWKRFAGLTTPTNGRSR